MNDIRKNLRALVSEFTGRGSTRIFPSFGPRLAETLKWHKNGGLTRTETLKKRGLPFTITQTYLGEEPAILFASHQRSESKRVVEQVALCAYHSAIEWGVVTNFSETVVFNSHWVKDNGWFRFPTIQSTNLLKCFDLLEALTPEGIRKNRIEELACSRSRPDHILVPVDDQLVDSLDTWRDEALRFSESPEAVDAKLQNLFAQLFILRAVEDRRLAPKIPLLSSCVDGNNSLDRRVIREIFDEARRHIQSELFESDIPKNIPDFILKGIIEDLYRPKNFPIRGVQYNFSWIEADVLGRAYEKYLSSVLVPSRQRDPQLFLFDQPLREVSRISRRKASGVYYTPDFVVRYLTEKSLDYFFDKTANKGKTKLPRVIDPSCGSGPFLRASADSLIRRLRQKDAKKNWGRELVKKRIIVGIDIDPKAITLARLSLWLRLAEEPDPLPLPHLKKNVVCGDSLRNTTWKNLPKTYDIVLGNPPFLAAAEAQVPEAVRKAFRSAQGRFDFSSLFIEQAVAKLKEGGYLGYVIPNRLFKNTYASEIRRLITENMRILTLVDFGSTEVFSGTSTYVGLILAEKDKDASRKKRIGVIEVNTLPFRFPGVTLVSGDVRYQIAIPNVKMYEAHHPNGEAPWNLLSDKAIGLRVQLQNANPTLGSLATVVQGIKTGANDIFVITIGKTLGSGLCEVTNGFGEHHLIEEGLLRPVVYGSEIQRYDVIDPQRFLLYPYSLNRPIPESDFRVQYPRTYEYLESYRDFLAVRSGIQNTSYGWYELVRKRQSSWLESKKILIRELATYPCFALDAQGGTYLIGGTAIVPINPGLLEPLLAYLNSSISGWYLEKSSPTFRGGYSKFEPSTIQQIPVPQVLIESDSFREKICDAVRELLRKHIAGDLLQQSRIENEIDDLFYKKLGISLDDID